jgi:UDP-N-acetylglucosamine acyltransferase
VSARIHPTAIIESSAEIDDEADIGPFCVIGPNVVIGPRVRLIANVFVERETSIGADTIVYPYAVLGTPGQDTSYKGEPTRLIIGERNIIREHVSMHRGTVRGRGMTVIGDDNFFMAQAHVAHDCIVGNKCTFAQAATLGGHVVVQDFVIFGGLSAVHQFRRVGRYAFIGAGSPALSDVIPYGLTMGNRPYLAGLNLVGLKRRGFAPAQIKALRAAYQDLFYGADPFQSRVDQVARDYATSAEVQEIIAFIRAELQRPILTPHSV